MKYELLVLLIGAVFLSLPVSAAGQSGLWEKDIQAGENASAQGRYAEAEQTYREALKLSEKFKEKDPRIAIGLIKLAESLSLQSKREEAEACANRSLLAIEKAIKGTKSKDLSEEYYKTETVAMILDKAAGIFVADRKYSEAEPIYNKVIAIREEAARVKESPKGNGDILKFVVQATTHARAKVANAYDKLAGLYFTQRRFDEAEPLYGKSIKIREAEYGVEAPPVALSLNRLATLYLVQGKYDKAEPLYVRAFRILERADLLDKAEVATAYQNYSVLLKKTGRESEASAMLEKARALRAK